MLIADEPTTALDVTTQKQILELIRRAQAERDMAVVLITHDFGVVAEIGDEVAVMQNGRIVESGLVADVLGRPAARLHEDAAGSSATARAQALAGVRRCGDAPRPPMA